MKETDTLEYVYRPDLPELYADHVGSWMVDGSVLRIEFGVKRLDPEQKPGKPMTGVRAPVCRLVLSPSTVLELYNHLNQVLGVMAQAKLIQPNLQAPGPSGPKN